MSAEHAVRIYLDALANPKSLTESEEIQKITAAIEAESDVIKQIRLQQELRTLSSIDTVRESFIAVAKEWADSEHIEAETFLDMKVPSDVLEQAGFDLKGKSGKRSGRRTSGKRVKTQEVIDAMPATGTFTVRALQDISGASPAVVRKAIAKAVSDNVIEDRGPDSSHSGPGRAARLYERS